MIRSGRVIKVSWRDACHYLDEYGGDADGCVLHTAGYFIETRNGFLVVAADRYSQEERYRHVTEIPLSGVIEIVVLDGGQRFKLGKTGKISKIRSNSHSDLELAS